MRFINVLLHFEDVIGLPLLIKKLDIGPVKANHRHEVPTVDCLNPVCFRRAVRLSWPEEKIDRAVSVLGDTFIKAVFRGKQLRRFRHGAVGNVVKRHRPEGFGGDTCGQVQLVLVAAVEEVAIRIPRGDGVFRSGPDCAHHHGRG